jgi:hypothetical protein
MLTTCKPRGCLIDLDGTQSCGDKLLPAATPSKLGLGPGLQRPRAHAPADNTYALVIEALDHPGSNLLVGHPFDVP